MQRRHTALLATMKLTMPHSAWDTALKLISGRDYSRAEMAAKLSQRGFPDTEITETLDKLERYRYIVSTGSDLGRLGQMAEEYLRKKKNPSSPAAFRSLEAFLLRKGFDPALVAGHLAALADARPGDEHGSDSD